MPSVGIAGWSYPDWDGYVYPRGVRDKLRFIAGYVDLIEINSTFYRLPVAKTVESWVKRTADLENFFFTAKLHRDVTHGHGLTSAMTAAVRSGFRPMLEAGKLRHLLAQFRYDFDDNGDNRDRLSRISESFGDLTELTVELRHISWQTPEALGFLTSLGVNLATLDYPEAHNSFNLPISPVGNHAYMRLHGRNHKAWFAAGAGRDETYNYRYSGTELEEIVARSVKQAAMSKTLTLVANNHYQGKEVAAALELKARLLGGKVDMPPGLAEKYEQLRAYRSDKLTEHPPAMVHREFDFT